MTELALIQALESPAHSHTKWVKRPWWRWTFHWDSERHEIWIRDGDKVEVPCSSVLEAKAPAKVERERVIYDGKLVTRTVASRMFLCPSPSVPGDDRVVLYAATLVDE